MNNLKPVISKQNKVGQSQNKAPSPQPVASPLTACNCEPKFISLNPKFTALPTACPCCKQVSLETAFQEPIVPTKTGYNLTHCKNTECKGYGLTLEHAAFMETMEARQQTAQDSDHA